MEQPQVSLKQQSNGELATEMYALERRYGQLSLWIAEADLKIYNMITTEDAPKESIKFQLDLKHDADRERYIILSNLKKIELEVDIRVKGVEINGNK